MGCFTGSIIHGRVAIQNFAQSTLFGVFGAGLHRWGCILGGGGWDWGNGSLGVFEEFDDFVGQFWKRWRLIFPLFCG